MSKKILLLALAAVSAVMLALPAMASALVPLHLSPTPVGAQTIHGSTAVLSTTSGLTFECDSVNGSATLDKGGTTGTMTLTYNSCTNSLFGLKCNVTTTSLSLDLVTLPNNKPGVLLTTTNGHFAQFPCIFFLEVSGNGVIGTITLPQCGETRKEMTIDFNATAHGVQEHTKVTGTETVYTLKSGSATVAQDMNLQLTLSNQTKLECT